MLANAIANVCWLTFATSGAGGLVTADPAAVIVIRVLRLLMLAHHVCTHNPEVC